MASRKKSPKAAGRIAGALGLDNLIMFYDCQRHSAFYRNERCDHRRYCHEIRSLGLERTLKSTVTIPTQSAVHSNEAKAEKERPTLIIGHTVMGKGARKADGSSYEADCATHGAPLGGDAYINTIKNLGGDPTNPFVIFPEVAELYAKRADRTEENRG